MPCITTTWRSQYRFPVLLLDTPILCSSSLLKLLALKLIRNVIINRESRKDNSGDYHPFINAFCFRDTDQIYAEFLAGENFLKGSYFFGQEHKHTEP